jgi:hypothetical protein
MFEDMGFRWGDTGTGKISLDTRIHRLSIPTMFKTWLMPMLVAQDISPNNHAHQLVHGPDATTRLLQEQPIRRDDKTSETLR